MPAEPRRRGPPQTPSLLRVHHLDRIAKPLSRLLLHLAENEPAAAADDQVELITADPHVRRQNPVPAHAVPPHSAPLGALATTLHRGKVRRADAQKSYGLRTELSRR